MDSHLSCIRVFPKTSSCCSVLCFGAGMSRRFSSGRKRRHQPDQAGIYGGCTKLAGGLIDIALVRLTKLQEGGLGACQKLRKGDMSTRCSMCLTPAL